MKLVDSPSLPRTPRELALIAIGLFGVAWGIVGDGPYGWQWSLSWAVATGLFALRAWPARGVAVGACLAALAQWACVSGLEEWPWIVNVPVVALALLVSRDLAGRFEGARSSLRWLPNPWATMPAADARRLRWCGYAGGVLAAVLCQMWMMHAHSLPATPLFFGSLGAAVALLVVGRAAALLPLTGMAGVVFVSQVRALVEGVPPNTGGVAGAAEATALAAVAMMLSAPYAWRLVRGTPRVETRFRVAVPVSLAPERLGAVHDVRGDEDEELAPGVGGATPLE